MSSTHSCIDIHFVFSTKERRRCIGNSWEKRLHAELGGILRKLGATAIAIGGDDDHVHVLARLKATHRPSDIARDLKSNSSGWVHNVIGMRLFDWQEGYGAFTVCSSDLGSAAEYINQQKEHHRRKTFQEEYLELLKQSGIEFDERYVW